MVQWWNFYMWVCCFGCCFCCFWEHLFLFSFCWWPTLDICIVTRLLGSVSGSGSVLPLQNMAITSAIISIGLIGDKNISHYNIKSWLKHSKLWFNIHFGQITKFKVIYNSIPHTPSKVGFMVRIIFSLTLDEAMSVGLVKACAVRKKSILL